MADLPVQSWGIVGYRHFNNWTKFCDALTPLVEAHGMPRTVVSGGATGTDTMAKRWAQERGIKMVEHLPAEYTGAALLGATRS